MCPTSVCTNIAVRVVPAIVATFPLHQVLPAIVAIYNVAFGTAIKVALFFTSLSLGSKVNLTALNPTI